MSRRKRYDGQFKAQGAIEAIKNQQTTAQIASAYDVHPNQGSHWKKQVLDQLPQLFTNKRSKATADSTQLCELLGLEPRSTTDRSANRHKICAICG